MKETSYLLKPTSQEVITRTDPENPPRIVEMTRHNLLVEPQDRSILISYGDESYKLVTAAIQTYGPKCITPTDDMFPSVRGVFEHTEPSGIDFEVWYLGEEITDEEEIKEIQEGKRPVDKSPVVFTYTQDPAKPEESANPRYFAALPFNSEELASENAEIRLVPDETGKNMPKLEIKIGEKTHFLEPTMFYLRGLFMLLLL